MQLLATLVVLEPGGVVLVDLDRVDVVVVARITIR